MQKPGPATNPDANSVPISTHALLQELITLAILLSTHSAAQHSEFHFYHLPAILLTQQDKQPLTSNCYCLHLTVLKTGTDLLLPFAFYGLMAPLITNFLRI